MSDDTSLSRKEYSSDLTSEQWALLEPMFPPNTGRGRPQTLSINDIIDAIFYINANGCKWADLPHDFPPPSSVSYHDRAYALPKLRLMPGLRRLRAAKQAIYCHSDFRNQR